MREEATFRCKWKSTSTGYTLWVPGYPAIKLDAADLSAGARAISELLLEHGVATTPFLELSPRPPVIETFRKFALPELYLVHGNEPCYSRSVDSATLHTGTICERCGGVSGVRNDLPLSLDCPVSGDGGFTANNGHGYHLFSGEFLKQLSIEERSRLQFREIQKPGRRPFFEIVGPPGVPTVAVAGLQPSGWFCLDCGRRTLAYFVADMPIRAFVSRSTLPTPLPTLFTVTDGDSLQLCATASRWDELREMRRSRGIVSQLLGVVDADEVIVPVLPEIEHARKRA